MLKLRGMVRKDDLKTGDLKEFILECHSEGVKRLKNPYIRA